MKAGDIMTGRVITISPDATVLEAIDLMTRNHISGLPVIDASGTLVGMVTEGDFLRRAETGTARKRPRWLEFLVGPGRLAEEYVETHARKVGEVMTREPITIAEDTPLDEVVHQMEHRRVKRLPVMRGTQLVGIVSRANLMRALAAIGRATPAPAMTDAAIRKQLLAENVPGVKKVVSHLSWVEPMSGMVISDADMSAPAPGAAAAPTKS